MSEKELTPEVQELLAQAAEDYAKYNSPERQEEYDYKQGFIGNNSGFTEEGGNA